MILMARDILKKAVALHNACKKNNQEGKCKECPFNVTFGCKLYGHPIDWDEKLKDAKVKNGV